MTGVQEPEGPEAPGEVGAVGRLVIPPLEEPPPAVFAPPVPAPAPPPPATLWRRIHGTLGPWVELVVVVALAFGAAYVVQWLIVKPYKIPSESMEDTLLVGDRVLVARFWYRFTDPARGDVVVFHPPGHGDEVVDRSRSVATDLNFIKRVVGLPGDWIGGYQGKVWVCRDRPPRRRVPGPGCASLTEPYVSSPQENFSFRQVPRGRYFMMGDNRDNSDDSRSIGTIPRTSILGRAFVTYWPLTRVGWLG